MDLHTQLTTAWRSPSNIAIVKYWGKHGQQFPLNPSVSLTLSAAHTTTHVTARNKAGDQHKVSFVFEGKAIPAFASRVEKYLDTLAGHLPFLHEVDLNIASSNSFPHSTGIASSASAMSALALCIADLSMQWEGRHMSPEEFFTLGSTLARLGSGSACRSVMGSMTIWGKTDLVAGSSDAYAVTIDSVDPVFSTYRDAILIVDDQRKAVSSSMGHALMRDHPYGEARLVQVQGHLQSLIAALRTGDLEHFGIIAEAEALTLHALMMTSRPSYLLMAPNTIELIKRIRTFRQATGTPVCFTLDAGPNVHLLYPDIHHPAVRQWIENDLLNFCKDGRVIYDQAGAGPVRIGDA